MVSLSLSPRCTFKSEKKEQFKIYKHTKIYLALHEGERDKHTHTHSIKLFLAINSLSLFLFLCDSLISMLIIFTHSIVWNDNYGLAHISLNPFSLSLTLIRKHMTNVVSEWECRKGDEAVTYKKKKKARERERTMI